jgi:hypothetical protein
MPHTYILDTQIIETVRANQVECTRFVLVHITWFTCTISGITSDIEKLSVSQQFNHWQNRNKHRNRASYLQ